jgi:hypothetical protein
VRERPALSERAVVTDLVRLADARSADPVRRFVFLMEAEQRARQRNLPGTVEARLGAAAEQVWALHRPAIERAFFDQARALVDEVEHGHAWVEFRGLYFDWVVRAGKVDEVFAVLLAEFGPAQLMAGVRHLRDALVADLRSEVVCRDLERMRQQQMDLEVNRLVWSLLNDATAFLAHERAGTPPSPDEVARLCQEVLGYAAGTPTERKLAAICRLVADEASGAVRTRVAAFMKRLPMGIWSSHEARHTLLPAMFAAAPR